MTTGDEQNGALSIGLITAGFGPSKRLWESAVTFVMREAAIAGEGIDADLRLNVVYMISDSKSQLDFEGVRTGTYFRSDRVLVVQAAVPEQEYSRVGSPDTLGRLLWDAISAAEEFGQRKKLIAEELTEARQIAARVTASPPDAWIVQNTSWE